MISLEDFLIDDYAENFAEEPNASWTFDYGVTTDSPSPGCIEILARLSNKIEPNRHGKSLYGWRVQRLTEDEYWLW